MEREGNEISCCINDRELCLKMLKCNIMFTFLFFFFFKLADCIWRKRCIKLILCIQFQLPYVNPAGSKESVETHKYCFPGSHAPIFFFSLLGGNSDGPLSALGKIRHDQTKRFQKFQVI